MASQHAVSVHLAVFPPHFFLQFGRSYRRKKWFVACSFDTACSTKLCILVCLYARLRSSALPSCVRYMWILVYAPALKSLARSRISSDFCSSSSAKAVLAFRLSHKQHRRHVISRHSHKTRHWEKVLVVKTSSTTDGAHAAFGYPA